MMPGSATAYASNAYDLHDLLSNTLSSTSHILIYSIPLILVSIPLVVAGAFLTLDRSRNFTPAHYSLVSPPRTRWRPARLPSLLRAGVGGIAIGFAFGAHCATFLSLLIPSQTSSAPLNTHAFLAVILLSALTCALVAGRWEPAARAFHGISGFASLSLLLSVILHPTLLARIVLTAALTFIGVLCCLIPISKYRHMPIRFAAAATGSFGLVLSISLLARIPAWSNIWARLWARNDIEWGTVQEKGLSAAYCIFLALGVVCDWFLHAQFGENPDERWDGYLAEYGEGLPNDKNRAGIFKPTLRHLRRPLLHLSTARSDERRIQFTPLPTDTAAVVKTEDKFFETSDRYDEGVDVSLFESCRNVLAVQPDVDQFRLQFWHDVKAKLDK